MHTIIISQEKDGRHSHKLDNYRRHALEAYPRHRFCKTPKKIPPWEKGRSKGERGGEHERDALQPVEAKHNPDEASNHTAGMRRRCPFLPLHTRCIRHTFPCVWGSTRACGGFCARSPIYPERHIMDEYQYHCMQCLWNSR